MGIRARIPFAKKLYRTRLWLRSEANISVIEHGSEKTQEFTAIAQRLLEKSVPDGQLRRALTPDHPMGCRAAGLFVGLSRGVEAGLCRGAKQSGAGICGSARW